MSESAMWPPEPWTDEEMAEHGRFMAAAFADPRNLHIDYLDLGNGSYMTNCVIGPYPLAEEVQP